VTDAWEKVVKALAAGGGAVIGLLGGWTPLLTVLCGFVALDYLTGLAVAIKGRSTKTKNGGLSSKAGFDGILRKALILSVVLMAALLDHALGDSTAIFTTTTVCYYIANEGLSILENLVQLGIPVPNALRCALGMVEEKAKLEDKDEKK